MADALQHGLKVQSDNGIVIGNQNSSSLHSLVFLSRLQTSGSAPTIRITYVGCGEQYDRFQLELSIDSGAITCFHVRISPAVAQLPTDKRLCAPPIRYAILHHSLR